MELCTPDNHLEDWPEAKMQLGRKKTKLFAPNRARHLLHPHTAQGKPATTATESRLEVDSSRGWGSAAARTVLPLPRRTGAGAAQVQWPLTTSSGAKG